MIACGTSMQRTLLAGATIALITGIACGAQAQSIIKNAGDHPNYKVELEPHAVLGWGHLWHGNGFGVGGRVGINVADRGFISSINNNVAISFGLDWLRYSDCYGYFGRFERGCGASVLVFPVTMQWNFWLTPHWSVFAEPGLYVYHGIWDDWCDERLPGCAHPTHTDIDFAFYAGGRFHFNETVALTMRIGYPSASIGVSFLF